MGGQGRLSRVHAVCGCTTNGVLEHSSAKIIVEVKNVPSEHPFGTDEVALVHLLGSLVGCGAG